MLRSLDLCLKSHKCVLIEKRFEKHNSSQWLYNRVRDRYVIKAHHDDYRSRSAYKLKQIDDKYSLLRKNQVVIDLGCYPGGWTQVAEQRCYPFESNAIIIAVDLKMIEALTGVTAIKGDIFDPETLAKLFKEMKGRKADVILSDVSPRLTGESPDDHLASLNLVMRAIELAEELLAEKGHFVTKLFSGGEVDNVKGYLRTRFTYVHGMKPKASSAESGEMFMVCKGYQGRIKYGTHPFESFSKKIGRAHYSDIERQQELLLRSQQKSEIVRQRFTTPKE
eukprot:GHVL01023650.1.p1 GENE.GHVL01023650.1~~GHVL01023650.1.p1  ORF type:complete len:279 (+),score=45.74 GHVL01023650.1:1056-1892(+)